MEHPGTSLATYAESQQIANQPPQDLAIEENHRKACDYIREAAAQGAELAVLPE